MYSPLPIHLPKQPYKILYYSIGRVILAKIQLKLTLYLPRLKCSITEKNTIQSTAELKIIFNVKGMNHG